MYEVAYAKAKKLFTKHGESQKRSAEYSSWKNMHNRCRNKKDKSYKNYGGRGIKVCARWKKFENFLADMGRKPSPELMLERVNNNLGYFPGNCIWATRNEQQRNRRSVRLITFQGATRTVTEWALQVGVDHETMRYRLANWSVERAFSTPPRKWYPGQRKR